MDKNVPGVSSASMDLFEKIPETDKETYAQQRDNLLRSHNF